MSERVLPSGFDTPELVVDRDRLYANVLGLQRTLGDRGIRLRPHAKTHKSVRIGRLQVEAGATGLTVGTLGEAEVFALAGLRDIFVAYPVWAEGPKAERVRALHGSEIAARVALVEKHADAFHRALVAELPVELLAR